MGKIQADERRFREFAVSSRVAGEGIEEQAVFCCLPLGNLFVDHIKGNQAAVCVNCQVLAPPLQANTAGGQAQQRTPFTGNRCHRLGKAGLERRLVTDRGDHPAGARTDEDVTSIDRAGSQSHCVLVMCAGYQHTIGAQAHGLGGFLSQLADHLAGANDLGQLLSGDTCKL